MFDRLMAFEFMTHAFEKLLSDRNCNYVVVYKDSKFDYVTIDFINSARYTIKQELIDLAKHLSV